MLGLHAELHLLLFLLILYDYSAQPLSGYINQAPFGRAALVLASEHLDFMACAACPPGRSAAASEFPAQNKLSATVEVPRCRCTHCTCVNAGVCHLPSRRLLEVQPRFSFLKMPVWEKGC